MIPLSTSVNEKVLTGHYSSFGWPNSVFVFPFFCAMIRSCCFRLLLLVRYILKARVSGTGFGSGFGSGFGGFTEGSVGFGLIAQYSCTFIRTNFS